MSKKKNEKEHWKEKEEKKIDERIKKLLSKQSGRWKELLLETSIAPGTLSKHLKKQIAKGEVEKYYNDVKKAFCYRIKNEELVKAQLNIHEAITFIESINNPLSAMKEDKGRKVFAFITGTGNQIADNTTRTVLNIQVSFALKKLKFPAIANQKIALILMTGVEP